VQEGDSVKKGQLLARIYADIYALQRDEAASRVSQTSASVENSRAALEALRANYNQAKLTYDRNKKLFDDKVISRAELEQFETTYKSTQANLNAAEQGLRGLQAGVKGSEVSLSRANKDLSRTTLVAPMDGVVSSLKVKKGERVAGNSFNVGTEMMTVADMSILEVRVDVGENDITKVKIGDTALVEVDAYNNRKFKGIVYKIANPVSTATSAMASSTEVANYKVHIRLFTESYQDLIKENAKFPFRPGMTASADIQTKSKVNVISVPLNAVTTRDKEGQGKETKVSSNATTTNEEPAKPDEEMSEVVFVLQKDNKVKMIKVKTDIQDLNYIQVEGVKVGDVVITGPYSTVSKSLKDGELVKPVTKEKLFEEKK